MRHVDEYVPGPTIYFVGTALVDMVKEYGGDQANITLKKERTQPTAQPWRIVAKRWELALPDLVRTTKSARQAQDLERKSREVLKEMYSQKALDGNAVRDLELYVDSLKPTPGPIQLFKNIKSAPTEYQPPAGG